MPTCYMTEFYVLLYSQHVKHTIPYLYVKPSSWRWTLGFETCRRHRKLNISLEKVCFVGLYYIINPLKPNDPYTGRTAPLTSRHCILYIYSTNICTEYFKHAAHSPFFSLQNAVYFTTPPCLVHVLFAFYIQDVLKFKCKILVPKD